jgi:hypothetical protein
MSYAWMSAGRLESPNPREVGSEHAVVVGDQGRDLVAPEVGAVGPAVEQHHRAARADVVDLEGDVVELDAHGCLLVVVRASGDQPPTAASSSCRVGPGNG